MLKTSKMIHRKKEGLHSSSLTKEMKLCLPLTTTIKLSSWRGLSGCESRSQSTLSLTTTSRSGTTTTGYRVLKRRRSLIRSWPDNCRSKTGSWDYRCSKMWRINRQKNNSYSRRRMTDLVPIYVRPVAIKSGPITSLLADSQQVSCPQFEKPVLVVRFWTANQLLGLSFKKFIKMRSNSRALDDLFHDLVRPEVILVDDLQLR